MGKQKRMTVAFAVMVLLVTIGSPAQAQFFDSGYPGMVGPMGMGPMGMGPYGMSMPFMPGMSPFGGMFGRQMERVTAITSLPATTGYAKDAMSVLESVPELSMFAAAVKSTAYGEYLRGRGNYIVFAPTDKAIVRDLGVKDARSLLADKNLVTGLVNNCIVYQPAGQNPSGSKAFIALNGKEVKLQQARTGISANGADVSNYLGASNGWVIVTDGAVGT